MINRWTFILTFLWCSFAFGQTEEARPKGVVFLECGGIAGYGSLNYQHLIYRKKWIETGIRVGISTIHVRDFRRKINPDIIVPISFNACFGLRHGVEIGLGNTLVNSVFAVDVVTPGRVSINHGNASIMYRYVAQRSGFMFKIGYTPLLEEYQRMRHWAGMAIGIQIR